MNNQLAEKDRDQRIAKLQKLHDRLGRKPTGAEMRDELQISESACHSFYKRYMKRTASSKSSVVAPGSAVGRLLGMASASSDAERRFVAQIHIVGTERATSIVNQVQAELQELLA